MRVLFLTDSLSDLDGVGRYSVNLIRALEALRPDLEVEVLLGRKHRPTSADVPARWAVTVGMPPDYFYYMSKPRFWVSFATAASRVRRRARGADLVHAIKDYPHSFAGAFGARLARKPCIATAHGTYSVQPLLDARHAKWARWTYASLAAVIAVSNHTRSRIVSILRPGELDPARVHVVPNAVTPPAAPKALAGARPWQACPFTLAIGEVKERKGHHLSLAAFCRVAARRPELHHFVVGKVSDDEYARSLVQIAREAGVADRVHWLGNVTEDEKADLLRRARVFVHTPVTSQDGGFEGFGIVYLEASACGVPVVGTRGSGAEDAIDDGVTGLLVAPEVDAIEQALERLLGDDALCKRLGQGGIERAERSSWADNARAVLAIYDRVLAEARR